MPGIGIGVGIGGTSETPAAGGAGIPRPMNIPMGWASADGRSEISMEWNNPDGANTAMEWQG